MTVPLTPLDRLRVVEPLPPGWLRDLRDPALADEYRADPFGTHSERLQRLLIVMDAMPLEGKTAFVAADDGMTWLARIPERPREPLQIIAGPFDGAVGTDQSKADFDARWETLFGEAAP